MWLIFIRACSMLALINLTYEYRYYNLTGLGIDLNSPGVLWTEYQKVADVNWSGSIIYI